MLSNTLRRDMRVFLTGGSGFIGGHLVDRLLAAGHWVTLATRNPGEISPRPGLTVVECDLQNVDTVLTALPGHDALVHNAIIWDHLPNELELKDTRASAKLFDFAGNVGIKQIIYTSSTAVHRPFSGLMSEGSYLQPADTYGAIKAASEQFLWAASHQFDIRCNVLRLGPVVGRPAFDGARFKSDRRIRQIVESAKGGAATTVQSGEGRQFIGASDVAIAVESLLNSNLNREVILCTEWEPTPWEDIARIAIHCCGSGWLDVGLPTESTSAPRFDVSKLERLLGLRFSATAALVEHVQHLADSF